MTLKEIEDFRQKISMSTASDLDKEILYTECDKRESFLLNERNEAARFVLAYSPRLKAGDSGFRTRLALCRSYGLYQKVLKGDKLPIGLSIALYPYG